jgi:hypothetical protein
MIKASKPPQSLTFQQIEDKFIKLSKPASYYSTETKDYGKDQPTPPIIVNDKPSGSKKKIYIILFCILLISVIGGLLGIFLYHSKRNTRDYNLLSPISSSYTPSTPNSYHPSTPN